MGFIHAREWGRDFDYKAEKILCTGKSGTGKSTLQIHLVKNLPIQHRFIFDHKAQFARNLGGHISQTERELLAQVNQRGNCIFHPGKMFTGQLQVAFTWFARWAFDIGKRIPGEKLLVFDEAGLLIPSHNGPYEKHPIKEHAETGREFRWNMVMASQKAGQLNNMLLMQLTKLFVFKTPQKRAAEYLIDSLGFEFDEIRALQNGEWICYDDDSGEFERGKLQL